LINSPCKKKKRTNYDALHYINFIVVIIIIIITTILLQPRTRRRAEILKYPSKHPALTHFQTNYTQSQTNCTIYTDLVPVLSIFIFQHISSENRASSNKSEGGRETKLNTKSLTVLCLYWLQNSPDYDVRWTQFTSTHQPQLNQPPYWPNFIPGTWNTVKQKQR